MIERVVDKFIIELDLQLNERKVYLSITPAARTYLAEKGYDRTFGARPMARLIHTEIKQPLANELLFGRLQNGGARGGRRGRRRAALLATTSPAGKRYPGAVAPDRPRGGPGIRRRHAGARWRAA